jgi:hypothetical protein
MGEICMMYPFFMNPCQLSVWSDLNQHIVYIPDVNLNRIEMKFSEQLTGKGLHYTSYKSCIGEMHISIFEKLQAMFNESLDKDSHYAAFTGPIDILVIEIETMESSSSILIDNGVTLQHNFSFVKMDEPAPFYKKEEMNNYFKGAFPPTCLLLKNYILEVEV